MDYVFYMRYCMARSRLHEGVDMNLRFLTELSAKGSTPCKWCKFHGRNYYL